MICAALFYCILLYHGFHHGKRQRSNYYLNTSMTILQSNFSDTLSLLILVFRHLLLVAMVRFCYGAFMLVLSLSLTFNVLTLIRYQTPLLILAPYRDSNLILAPYHYSNLTPSPYSLLPAPMTLTLTFQVSVGCGLSIVEQNHMRPYL